MKELKFSPDKPYMIIGSGNEMSLLVISKKHDKSTSFYGGKNAISAPYFVWRPVAHGEIKLFTTEKFLEFRVYEDEGKISFHRYYPESNIINTLYVVDEFEELFQENRLLRKGEVWYLNSLDEENFLGKKFGQFFLKRSPVESDKKSLISKDFFNFGSFSYNTVSFLNKKELNVLICENILKTSDGYLLLDNGDLSFSIIKDNHFCYEPEIVVNILGTFIKFELSQKKNLFKASYFLAEFGGIRNIKKIEILKDDECPRETDRKIVVSTKRETFVFFHSAGEFVKPLNEVIINRKEIDGRHLYKIKNQWYEGKKHLGELMLDGLICSHPEAENLDGFKKIHQNKMFLRRSVSLFFLEEDDIPYGECFFYVLGKDEKEQDCVLVATTKERELFKQNILISLTESGWKEQTDEIKKFIYKNETFIFMKTPQKGYVMK
ncbi:MAG: hypothetical protein PHE89_01795 [Alphaproteobacteria bacterium]|nr:hypothetical protein [Alphaproteobacteria bacterium]